MAGSRQYPGEQLVERLLARGERRLRVGVSSAFFARFGLDNPWDLDSAGIGWGAPLWGHGGRAGRPRGVLGSFWEIFERRMMGHLMGGVIFRGGLGLSVHHPWADWLPFLDQSGMGWMWRDRALGAFSRLPGFEHGRPRSPWGPFASPRFSFLLPELEEVEAEEPSARRRFRRRPRRARQALEPTLPSAAAAAPGPLAPAVQVPRPGRAALPLPAAGARLAARPATPETSWPVLARPTPARAPAAQGMARVLERQQASVGTPSLRRAVERRLPESGSSFAALQPQPAQVVPALQGPLAWAETRLQQADEAPSAGRPRPVASATMAAPVAGMPPAARRALRPVMFRSPTLAFLAAPEPVVDLPPQDEPTRWAPPRRPSRTRPAAVAVPTATPRVETVVAAPPRPAARAVDRVEPHALPAPGQPQPASPPATSVRVPRPAASARVAQRLQAVQQLAPPVTEQPYRALRRASSAPSTDSAAPTPLLRAVARMPAVAGATPLSSASPDAPSAAPTRSLDRLLMRPASSPGLPGRLHAAERAVPGATVDRGLSATVVRGAQSSTPFRARSPMLAFLDVLEQVQAEPPAQAEPIRAPRSRRVQRAAPSGSPPPPHQTVPQRPLRQAASRALLRGVEPTPGEGSVLPRPVARQSSDQPLSPLSATAFPGRRQLSWVRQVVHDRAALASDPTRAMRVPWLPVDRLVQPSEPLPGLEPDSSQPRQDARRPARTRAERAAAAAPSPRAQAQAAPSPRTQAPTAAPAARAAAPSVPERAPTAAASVGAQRPALRASARAVARLAELQAPPAPARPLPAAPSATATAHARAPSTARAELSGSAPIASAATVLPSARALGAAPGAADPAATPASRPPRASGTQRAMHRLEAGPLPSAGIQQAASSAAPSPFSRQAWASVRAPSTVWLQWREPSAIEPEEATLRWSPQPSRRAQPGAVSSQSAPVAAAGSPRSWAPVSSAVAAPIRAGGGSAPAPGLGPVVPGQPPRARLGAGVAPLFVQPQAAVPPGAARPALPAGRALPSGRALGRLAARSRVQQRAVAVAGAPSPFGGPTAPRAALLQAGAPDVQPLGPDGRPRPSARVGTPRPAVAARAAGAPTASPSQAPAVQVSAIDKLLADGAGAQVLIPALARVERPDEALRIVLERTLGWRGRGPLPTPVRQLVERVQAASGEADSPAARSRSSASGPRREALRRRRPAARRRRSVSAPSTEASATVHHVQANHRIAGLVKKLEQLIHLVDVEHRLAAARSQVRMAEDSPAARQPGSPDASPEAQADQAGQDVDSLVQHIVEAVSEEMSMFSQRRPEDPANRTPWF